MSFHPANHLPGCMMPDGGDCCAGHAAVVDDWHRQRREIERLRHPAQAAPEPGEILQILEDEVYCDKFDGSYDYGDAVPRILALFATQPPAAPVDQERLAELQNEAGMYKSLYENAIAQRSSAGTDQEGWDLVAKSWVVLESYGFAPEACDYLPQAIDNALAAVIGARDDLLAEVTRLRAAPQSPLEWLAGHTNYELSFSGWDEDPAWLVHSVNGGRNDREWTLLSTGSTPEEALRKAMARTVTRPHEKSRGAEFPSHGRNTP
jgi:hypothetical protein